MLHLSLITGDSVEQNQLWLLGPVKQYKIGLLSDGGLDTSIKNMGCCIGFLTSNVRIIHIYIYI